MCVLAALSRTFSRTVRKQNESSGKGIEAEFAVRTWGKVLSDESPKQSNQQHMLPTIHVASMPTIAKLFSWCFSIQPWSLFLNVLWVCVCMFFVKTYIRRYFFLNFRKERRTSLPFKFIHLSFLKPAVSLLFSAGVHLVVDVFIYKVTTRFVAWLR